MTDREQIAPGMVEVTQLDRNAAINLLEAGGQDWQAQEIRLRSGDHFPIVQALARHREAAEAKVIADVVAMVGTFEAAADAGFKNSKDHGVGCAREAYRKVLRALSPEAIAKERFNGDV